MKITPPSFWQNSHWKEYRELCGEKTFQFEEDGAKALIIEKSPNFLKFWKKPIWELQRGPFGNIKNTLSLFKKIFSEAKKNNILCVRIFPPLGIQNFWGELSPILNEFKTSFAPEIFPQHTLLLDIKKTNDEIFSQMKQGGRRNIRKAIKNNIEIFEEKNIKNFWKLLKETAKRDGFTTNKKFIYEKILSAYSQNNSENSFKNAILLSAKDKTGEILSSKIFLISGDIAVYYYGTSSNKKRNLMAPYLLQWEGIKWAKTQGAKIYDFLGISPENDTKHKLAGVSQFKLKFGGKRVISDIGIDFFL